MLDGYAWITSNIMFQAPWDPVNFDRTALKSDLNEIPQIVVKEVRPVNRRVLSYWKEADVWFEITDEDLTKQQIRDKMINKIESPNRAREAVRRLEIGPSGSIPVGEVPSGVFNDGEPPWVTIGATVLTITFMIGIFNLLRK